MEVPEGRGTRDPTFFLYKQKLITPNKNLKFIGYAGMIAFGAVFTVAVIRAIAAFR